MSDGEVWPAAKDMMAFMLHSGHWRGLYSSIAVKQESMRLDASRLQ